MKVMRVTCAPPNPIMDWHSVNWKECYRTVKAMQSRIVKAYQAGRLGKVRALQGILTRSFAAKAIAVKRVTELNQGKKTPGIDNELWDTPTAKADALLNKLSQIGYRSLPLKRIFIPKNNGKRRPLGIPTMKDRGMQMLFHMALEPIAEEIADNNSYGFRQKRSCADAIEQCFSALASKSSAKWILEADIKSCFDKISHEHILANTLMDTRILRQWLKCGLIFNGKYSHTNEGTPQGGIISPILANLTLDGMEQLLKDNFKWTKKFNPKVNLVRYADDFIITSATKELLENEVKPLITKFLSERGLELSEEKTKITHINDGFDFLGQNIRKYEDKLLIKPSNKNVKTFLNKVKTLIDNNKTATQDSLIRLLNPLIRGWTNYHQHVVSKETFNKVQHKIWLSIWKWCRRRHPNKPRSWIVNKYLRRIGSRGWIFMTDINRLLNPADTPIVRHIKIRSDMNPYDSNNEIYFEKRGTEKMKNAVKGNKRLSAVLKRQDGRCPICEQLITLESQWHLHYINPKYLGGKDTLENLIALHPNCHRQVHSKSTDKLVF